MKNQLETICVLACILLASSVVPAAAGEEESQIPAMPKWQSLYVGDFGAGRIYKVSHEGNFSVYAQGLGAPGQLVFDGDGNLYVAAAGAGTVWKITPTRDGSPATEKNGHLKLFCGGLLRPMALTFDPDDNLWVSEYVGEEYIDENGEKKRKPGALHKITPEGEKVTIAPELEHPYGLAAGPDGNIYLAKLGGFEVVRYTLEGESTVLSRRAVYWLRNVEFGPDGTLYALGGKGISTIAADGKVKEFCDWKRDGFRGTHRVGLGFDANGTLYSTAAAEKPRTAESRGYVYQHGPDGTHRVFARVGVSPFYIAFYPKEADDESRTHDQ